jgi:3-hydroxybutyryl-CoA dehydrogenase
MHFFNPPPLMPLLEIIRADQTADGVLALAEEVGRAMGKEVIVAADGPGFLVNRCGRPFNGEGLRLLQERVATHDQIDRICRLGGGFRMGPFELMDLVGIDVGFAVAQSFDELSFGEPRWRPNPIQARMVAAGRLGRKTGRGYYEYAEDGSYRPDDPEPPEPAGGDGTPLALLGDGPLADSLRERARSAGYELREGGPAELVVDAGIHGGASPPLPGGAPALVLCAGGSLASRGEPGAVGFHLLPVEDAKLVELTRLPTTQSFAAEAAEHFFAKLGFLTQWVEDAPGLVLGRIVAQLVNEAAFAIGEGVGTADDVDTGLTLGLSHPRGPIAWSEAAGLDHITAILNALWTERREERYRTAPLLHQAATLGRGLR